MGKSKDYLLSIPKSLKKRKKKLEKVLDFF